VTVRPAGHKALLAAASAQFAARGYHAVSIREIASAAGVSLSALYHYYPSKQALLAALLHEGMDDYQARCAEALKEAGHDPARQLAAVVGATVRYRAERSEASLLLMNEARALEPEERRGERPLPGTDRRGRGRRDLHHPVPRRRAPVDHRVLQRRGPVVSPGRPRLAGRSGGAQHLFGVHPFGLRAAHPDLPGPPP
jgi:AcrR family transcriptional regulator